jgi:hypothetical protein
MQLRVFVAARDALASAGKSNEPFAGSIYAKFRAAGATGGGAESVRRLEAALQLLRYRKELPLFFVALSELELVPGPTIQQLHDGIASILVPELTLTLRDVPAALARVRVVLGEFEPSEVTFVAELFSHGGLLEFLAKFELIGPSAFHDRAVLVTGQLQGGGRIETEIVSSLVGAVGWLRPFYAKSRPIFSDVSKLRQAVSAIADLESKTAVVRNLTKSVPLLKDLFSADSSKAIRNRVNAVLANGSFISSLSSPTQTTALELEYAPTADGLRQVLSEVSDVYRHDAAVEIRMECSHALSCANLVPTCPVFMYRTGWQR